MTDREKEKKPLEWKKFTGEEPKCDYVWLASKDKVWLQQSAMVVFSPRQDPDSLFWAEANLILPSPPEKMRHDCKFHGWRCYEPEKAKWERSELRLVQPDEKDYVVVAWCCFCGYEVKKWTS